MTTKIKKRMHEMHAELTEDPVEAAEKLKK